MKTILRENLGIDSNIILYALDESSPHHLYVKKILNRLYEEEVPVFITHQNILESFRVLVEVYKVEAEEALKSIQEFIAVYSIELVTPQLTTIYKFSRLYLTSRKKKKDIFDLYLATTLLDNNINQILTLNTKDFKSIPNLHILTP